jgi:hypothetical protein
MTPPIENPDNERRLELHFPDHVVDGGATLLTSLPLGAAHGLRSDEWLRPEYLILHDDVSVKAFQVATLSIRHQDFEGHEIVLPMQLMPGEPGVERPGAIYQLTGSECPPTAHVFLAAHNMTKEEQTFRGSLTLIAVRGGRRSSAPFTPIPSLFADYQETTPSNEPASFNERLMDKVAAVFNAVIRARRGYLDLKKDYEAMLEAKKASEQFGVLYPNLEETKQESIKGIIAQSLREGLSLASFPLRVGSMVAGKGLEDLKNLLSGKREKLEGKETFLPLPTADVDPGQDKVLIVEPMMRMSPTRLAAHYETANDFSLIDIKVGKNCQLLAYIPVDFSTLIGLGESFRMKMDEAGPGKPIIITVRNTSLKTAKFRAVVVGYVVD